MMLNTTDEKNLLLFFECMAVDYGGTVESIRMNADDFAIARRWNKSGFVQFGRIAFHDIRGSGGVKRDHWVVLSEQAWTMAHAERRARCERRMSALTVERNGLVDAKATTSARSGDLLAQKLP